MKSHIDKPLLIDVGSGAVICPYCNCTIIPEYNSENENEEEAKKCEHLQFIFIWKGEYWDVIRPSIVEWWNKIKTEVEDANGFSLRDCPFIDTLIEHSFCCGPANWAYSFGFSRPK